MSHSISFWIESRFNFTASYLQKPVAIQKRRVSYELTGCRFTSELNVRASGCNLRSFFRRRASSSPHKGRRPPTHTLGRMWDSCSKFFHITELRQCAALYLPLSTIARSRRGCSNPTLCQSFSINEDTPIRARLSGMGLAHSVTVLPNASN